jgi:hypothetical protein
MSGNEPIEIESSPEEDRRAQIDFGDAVPDEGPAGGASAHEMPVDDASVGNATASPEAMQIDLPNGVTARAAESIAEDSAENESDAEDGDSISMAESDEAEAAVKVSIEERLAELAEIDALLCMVPRKAAEALSALNPAVRIEQGTTRAASFAEAATGLLDALEASTARLKRSVRALELQEVVTQRMGVALHPQA